MKRISILLAMSFLILSSLACETITRGFSGQAPTLPPSVEMPGDTTSPDGGSGGGNTSSGSAQFPLPSDADVSVTTNDTVIFQTNLSLDEAMQFYRDAFKKEGLTERELLTVTSDTTFSFVFDGDKSGKAIVVQGVKLDNGKVNVTITLQDI